MITIGYLINICSITYSTVTDNQPCLIYLWLNFIKIILITIGYLVKAFQIYALSINGSNFLIDELKNSVSQYYTDFNIEIPKLDYPDSNIVIKDNTLQKFIRIKVNKARIGITYYISSNPKFASKNFCIKLYIGISFAFLIIPLLINACDPINYKLSNDCDGKMTTNIIGLLILIIPFIICYLLLLLELRKLKVINLKFINIFLGCFKCKISNKRNFN